MIAIGVIMYWLWTGTAVIPEKEQKSAGLGLTLPLYLSGRDSVSWWAVFITLTAAQSAFVCLIFGYFFFWTANPQFPPPGAEGPGLFWPATSAALIVTAWILMILARRWNAKDQPGAFYAATTLVLGLTVAAGAALAAGPLLYEMDPKRHVYDATVWVLVIWSGLHLLLAFLFVGYTMARRLAGQTTARHEIEVANTTLCWHFTALTVVVTVAVIAGFPLVA
jgi:cytochrome c oxidase subunit I+III